MKKRDKDTKESQTPKIQEPCYRGFIADCNLCGESKMFEGEGGGLKAEKWGVFHRLKHREPLDWRWARGDQGVVH